MTDNPKDILCSSQLGILVGLKAEADQLKKFFPNARFAMSGASARGAHEAARELARAPDIHYLLSCGLAAGLHPHIKPGDVTLPIAVKAWDEHYPTSSLLRGLLRTPTLAPLSMHPLLHSDKIVTTSREKTKLFEKSGCDTLDMESGYLAYFAHQHKKAFAALRVVCDPAMRSLPPAASLIMETDGTLDIKAFIRSLLTRPWQIVPLIQLGLDAGMARHKVKHYLRALFESLT